MFVRRHVHGARGVVEDQDLRLLHNGARNAQALLLAAGEVRGVLLQNGLIAVREAVDEFVRAGDGAGLAQLLLRGVGIAPAEILRDRAGEQRAVLQHHGNAVAQGGYRRQQLRLLELPRSLRMPDAVFIHFKQHAVFPAHDGGIEKIRDKAERQHGGG